MPEMIVIILSTAKLIAPITRSFDVQAGVSRYDAVSIIADLRPAEALAAAGDFIQIKIILNLYDHFISDSLLLCCFLCIIFSPAVSVLSGIAVSVVFSPAVSVLSGTAVSVVSGTAVSPAISGLRNRSLLNVLLNDLIRYFIQFF
jgi:hypothetical protein